MCIFIAQWIAMVSFESICGELLICVAEVSRLEPQSICAWSVANRGPLHPLGSDHNPQSDAKSKSPKV